MRDKSPYKQFAKDCPNHFSEDVLKNAHLSYLNEVGTIRKEKSTSNSKFENKF